MKGRSLLSAELARARTWADAAASAVTGHDLLQGIKDRVGAVKRRYRKRSRFRRGFGVHFMRKVAFSFLAQRSVKTCAKSMGCSPKFIRRSLRVSAHCLRLKQAEFLRTSIEKVRRSRHAFMFYTSSLSFDETTQRLRLPIGCV